MKSMDPSAYLQRISASFTDLSLENVALLQRHHMQYVPFENLDVMRNVPIYLNIAQFYDKIVKQKRGGYCYEVNGLFRWLLAELGFTTFHIAATVKRPTGKFARPNTHMAIIVELDQPYLVDVGFGNSNYEPIPLDGTEQTDVSGTYKVQKVDNEFFDLMRKEPADWRTLYRFTLEPKQLIDFHEGVTFNQVSKESTFTHNDLVTIATEEGRMTLRGNTLTTTVHGDRDEIALDDVEKRVVLEEVFGIQLDNQDDKK